MTFLSVILRGVFCCRLAVFFGVRDPVDEDKGNSGDDDKNVDDDRKILPPNVLIAREKRKNDLDSASPIRWKIANPII